MSRAENGPPRWMMNTIFAGPGRLAKFQWIVPGETAGTGELSDSSCSKRGGQAASKSQNQEDAMRLVDVVLASALLGLALGFVHTGLPGARASGDTQVASSDCGRSMCERITWLRTPLMRRSASAE